MGSQPKKEMLRFTTAACQLWSCARIRKPAIASLLLSPSAAFLVCVVRSSHRTDLAGFKTFRRRLMQ